MQSWISHFIRLFMRLLNQKRPFQSSKNYQNHCLISLYQQYQNWKKYLPKKQITKNNARPG